MASNGPAPLLMLRLLLGVYAMLPGDRSAHHPYKHVDGRVVAAFRAIVGQTKWVTTAAHRSITDTQHFMRGAQLRVSGPADQRAGGGLGLLVQLLLTPIH
jgi:hypothetical protein